MSALRDVVGKRFGRLVVLRRAGDVRPLRYKVVCACDCGNECVAWMGDLNSGHKSSCGCIKAEIAEARKAPSGVKECQKCSVVKPLGDFYNQRGTPTGKAYKCKACCAEYARTNSESLRAWHKENYLNNKHRISERNRQYRDTHAAQLKARRQTPAHRSMKSIWDRGYYERHTAALKQRSRVSALENPEMYRAYKNSYKAKKRAAFVEFVDLAAVYERDMGLCQICGLVVEDGDFSLDHRIPIAGGGKHSIENCQTAHLICNIRKQDKPPERCGPLWMRS